MALTRHSIGLPKTWPASPKVGHAGSGVNASRPNAALSRTLPVRIPGSTKLPKELGRTACSDRDGAHDYLRAVEQRIASTPAEDLAGIGVQLALWEFIHQHDDGRRRPGACRLQRGGPSDGTRFRIGGGRDLEPTPNRQGPGRAPKPFLRPFGSGTLFTQGECAYSEFREQRIGVAIWQ
jgi:hypothetical protein